MWTNNPNAPGGNSIFEFTWDKQIIVRNGRVCLDIPWGNYASGQMVQQYLCNGNANQRWFYNPSDYTIRVDSDPRFCLTIINQATWSYAGVMISTCNNTAQQKWKPVTA